MLGSHRKKLTFRVDGHVQNNMAGDFLSQKILNALPSHIAVVNHCGVLQFVNTAWLDFARENDGDLAAVQPGISYLKVCEDSCDKEPTQESSAALHGLRQVLSGKIKEFTLEYPCHSPEIKRWFYMHCRQMVDPSGWAVISHENISKRKKAERALKESEELYQSLFEKNTSMILLVNPDSGRVVDANPAACAFYGFSRYQMKHLKVTDFNILKEDELREDIQKAVSGKKNHFEFEHKAADGSIRDVEVFAGPIKLQERTLLCSIIHDVSAKKQAEKERDVLISDLQSALNEIKVLRGILPICANCKKIRDDSGYWENIESYINKHSDASFSHGICPDCVRELYPDIAADVMAKYFNKK
jgi:PAS domain S-box-containing protein